MNFFEVKSEAEINEKERSIIHYITTKDLDWGNDIINPLGMDSKKYEKHRVVLYNHNENKPIAKNIWLKSKEDGNIASTYFSKKSLFANEIYDLHKEGIINTWSVRWTPLEANGEAVEDALKYDMAKNIRYINKWELIEYSSAPLAMNYGAVDLIKGFVKSDELIGEIKKMELEKQVNEITENYKKDIDEIKSQLSSLEEIKSQISVQQEIKKEIEEIKLKLKKSVEILGDQEAKKLADEIVGKLVAGEVSRSKSNN